MKYQLQEFGEVYFAYTGGKPLRPELPTVLLLHGAQNDHSVWILQSRYLAHHGFNVLAFDLPGHGRSQGTPLVTVEAMAQWVAQSIENLGIASFFAVGHSMGSLIALELAGTVRAQSCRGLALLGSAYPMAVSASLLSACETDETKAIGMINQWSHSGITHSPGSPGPGFSIFNQGLRLMQRQSKGVLAKDFHACNNYLGGERAAAAVRCPTLLISGATDLMTPPKSTQWLSEQLRASGLTVSSQVINECGHQLMAEKPDQVLRALTNWISQC